VKSAGTNGFHNGEAPHLLSQKVAKASGVDISKQISRKFVAVDFDLYDKIYVMAADVMDGVKKIAGTRFNASKVDFFMNELHPNENREVPDPWYGNEDGYVKVYKLIDETCDAIIAKY
jgi:protein-tyrosine phosphatase